MSKISERKQYEIRKKKKALIRAMGKAIDGIESRLDQGKPATPQELTYLSRVFNDWKVLEESMIEEKTPVLPEGKLKEFVEKGWKMAEICKDHDLVIELANYYRCDFCGELHSLKRKCMYSEYKELNKV